jgi:hypothetical protein
VHDPANTRAHRLRENRDAIFAFRKKVAIGSGLGAEAPSSGGSNFPTNPKTARGG